ncbi:MAG: phenylacetate--CoA ligase, partial [Thermoplasmata archaeon]|nr:phenylacetate--CoA ligase [Thermoplasmata archaeon]
IFGAETFTKEMKRRLSKMWDMDVHDIYGLTEMCGPGVSSDCDAHDGLHLWEDHFLPEIIDPNTGDVIGKEEEGELVLTTLTKEGMPIIRYRTRDITFLYDGECECRRTHVRHAPIKGRSDDMIIVKGTNLFPGQIEDVIMKNEHVSENWLMIIERNDMDEITVKVEAKEKVSNEEAKKIAMDLQQKLRIATTLRMNVEILPPDSLPKQEGKVKRVIDRRS